jgi:hypothetical protein
LGTANLGNERHRGCRMGPRPKMMPISEQVVRKYL